MHAIAQRNSVRLDEAQTLEEVREFLAPEQQAEFERVKKNLPQLPLRWLGEEWVGIKPYVTHERILDKAVSEA